MPCWLVRLLYTDVHLDSLLGSWVSGAMADCIADMCTLTAPHRSLGPWASNGLPWSETFYTCLYFVARENSCVASVEGHGSLCWTSLGFPNTSFSCCFCSLAFAVVNLSHVYKLLLSLVSPSGFTKGSNHYKVLKKWKTQFVHLSLIGFTE